MGEISRLAVSLRGHDRNKIFVICGEDETCFDLADGRSRTLLRPKKKKKKHVQVIRRLPSSVNDAMRDASSDSDIVHILRLYRRHLAGCEVKTAASDAGCEEKTAASAAYDADCEEELNEYI